MSQDSTNVAIACQGGGSHTAFTAGVLRQLLEERSRGYEVTALSGTSGGALCALVTWYALRTADAETARENLRNLWEDIAATGPYENAVNAGVVGTARLLHAGFPIPQVSPTQNPLSRLGRAKLRQTIERYVDPETLDRLVAGAGSEPPPPKLLVSAVDATDGAFEIFTDRPDGEWVADSAGDTAGRVEERPQPLTIDAVLASAAVPNLFEPMRLRDAPDGQTHDYWDGLLSQNPPVRNLLDGPDDPAQKPDEIWLVRINPTTQRGDLSALDEIADRRNELAGSLSLSQELFFLKQVNEWLESDVFSEAATERFKPVTVRQVELDERRLDSSRDLQTATKLDRNRGFIRDLLRLGEEQATEFLDGRERGEPPLIGPAATTTASPD